MEIGIRCLSILFMILSASSFNLSKVIVKQLEADNIFDSTKLSAILFEDLRHALQATGYGEKPTFLELQSFFLGRSYI